MDRLKNLDNIKFFAAFLVICIHVSYQEGGIIIRSIYRVAVPLFVLITGYFFPVLLKRNKSKEFLKKIIILTISSSVFYFITNFFVFHSNPIPINWQSICDFIFLNQGIPYTAMHLWYLNALIYTILIAILCQNYLYKLYYLIPILFILGYIISSITTHYLYYRNFIFVTLPYFLTGHYIQYHKEKISRFIKDTYQYKFILLFFIETILLGIEIFIYQKHMLPVHRDFYFMTFPMALTIFISALFVFPDKEIRFITYIGQKYSTGIYIFHIFTIETLSYFTLRIFDIKFRELYYVNTFIIFFTTILLIYLYYTIKKLIITCITRNRLESKS